MKKQVILVLLISTTWFRAVSQNNTLLKYKKCFEHELKRWANTFQNFDLSNFEVQDTMHFDNDFHGKINRLNEFLDIYKSVVAYSPDSTMFIDLYSYQLNLEKRENSYLSNPTNDQAVLLYDIRKKYWSRIYFGTSMQWVEDVIWLNNMEFILTGVTNIEDQVQVPVLFLGKPQSRQLIVCVSRNKECSRRRQTYLSPVLKNINIKGL